MVEPGVGSHGVIAAAAENGFVHSSATASLVGDIRGVHRFSNAAHTYYRVVFAQTSSMASIHD
jgi:hypothetical protein